MNRRTWITLLGILVGGLLAQRVQAQNYSPGPGPIVGDIVTQTVADYPAPKTRLSVGIGEQVNCSIDSSTWQDIDYSYDQYGTQTNVYDDIGTVTWSATNGTMMPTVGLSSTLTVNFLEADDQAIVTAMVDDAGDFAKDPALAAPVQKLKVFNVSVPKTIKILTATDNPPAAWVKGTKNFGAQTTFLHQITGTNPANFSAVGFVVQTNAAKTWTWDDKTPGSYGPLKYSYRVANFTQGQVTTPNLVNLKHTIPLTAVTKVTQQPKAGVPPEMHVNPHYYYLDAGGTQLGPNFATVNVHWSLAIPGGSNSVAVGADAGGGAVWGGTQGPWN